MKRAVKTKTEIKPKAPNKGTNETTYKRVEETIIIKKKVNPYIDNYSYVETKNILNNNPRFQVIVEHRRKGDIIGGGNFEETSYQRQVYSQGGNRPNLPAQDQKLRSNKSEVKMMKQTVTKSGSAPRGGQTTTTTKKTTTTTKTTTREKKPVSSTGGKEKVVETTMKRRNEGTGTKTQTKTESKTTTSGLRGQQTTSTSSKTTTTTTKIEAKDGNATGGSIRKKFAKK
jgi:hypothetical protein